MFKFEWTASGSRLDATFEYFSAPLNNRDELKLISEVKVEKEVTCQLAVIYSLDWIKSTPLSVYGIW